MNTKLLGTAAALAVCYVLPGSYASTPSGKTDIYSESLYLEKSSAEIPGSLESNARLTPPPAPAPAAKTIPVAKPKQAAIETIAEIEKPKIKYLSDDAEETVAAVEPELKKHNTKKIAKRSR